MTQITDNSEIVDTIASQPAVKFTTLTRPSTDDVIEFPDDVAVIRLQLGAMGFLASDTDIQWAWRIISDRDWSAEWMPLHLSAKQPGQQVLDVLLKNPKRPAAVDNGPEKLIGPVSYYGLNSRLRFEMCRDIVVTYLIAGTDVSPQITAGQLSVIFKIHGWQLADGGYVRQTCVFFGELAREQAAEKLRRLAAEHVLTAGDRQDVAEVLGFLGRGAM